MDFNFTDEQTMLRDSVGRYLSDTYTFDARMTAVNGDSGWNPGVWKAFAEELGILGAPFAEAHGGLGGGAIENMIVMEEIGKALVIEPYLQTVVIGGGFLKAAGGALADAVIPQIIDGSAVIAFAYAEPQGRYNLADLRTTAKKDGAGYVLNGHKAVVYAAPWATHFIVTARTGGSVRERSGVSVFLIPANAAGITRRDYPTVDGARASEVYFENVAIGADTLIGAEGEGLPLVEQVVDEATAAVCAEGSGVVRKLHEGTLDYSRQRKQFGKAIGEFQVLQHRMVDMFMEVEQAVSMTLMATLRLDERDRAKHVSSAKNKISRGARFVGQNAVQIHGGIGISNELAIGHYFKRASMIESQFGDADYHLRRYESLMD
ncbi:acyl-CoA dehydrogenase family protein [Glacieibacterium megasporae]|uniref:acyl-CoA dehydrogenase family protein n=1 Tax=Glacieibacterium megasporae TaxID=2835787 RepID=UPI001C1DFB2D|nr:acyl-CoA dehydrogenase family protein [Polymorphobacter megasporae]UAJ11207.1 acyl-CoA dehydrogenase family protein [Polymorphobacter megasporae]